MRRWSLFAAAVTAAGLLAGCGGSDSSDDGYQTYLFVNSTEERIEVWRDGGEEWQGNDRFTLEGENDQETVTLAESGEIDFRYASAPGSVEVVQTNNVFTFER